MSYQLVLNKFTVYKNIKTALAFPARVALSPVVLGSTGTLYTRLPRASTVLQELKIIRIVTYETGSCYSYHLRKAFVLLYESSFKR